MDSDSWALSVDQQEATTKTVRNCLSVFLFYSDLIRLHHHYAAHANRLADMLTG